MSQEYLIYCDESIDNSKYFSNFYGRVLVRSSNLGQVQKILQDRKIELNLLKEAKWSKVTDQYLQLFAFKPATNNNIKPIAGLRPATLLVAGLINNCCK